MKKDQDKKKKEKEEPSHLEEFYKLRSPQDIAVISLNKQKSHSLFLYGNIRNNFIKKMMIKEVLVEKQKKEKQKQQNEQRLRDYASSKLVPEIINDYQQASCVNKEFCKFMKIKFENQNFYASLNESYRNKMWLIATDGFFQIRENKHYYQKILRSKDIPNVYEDFIEKDLMRSFSKYEVEQCKEYVMETVDKLRNVLSAYSKRNCITGYCQGMNFIAKFILTLKFTEEQAFWIYKYFLESIIPLDYFTHNMIGLLADQNIFKNLLHSHNPKVFKKFQEIKIDVNIFTTSWFICMYTNSLSPQLCTVVFDHCILYGTKTVFAVGLVLLDLLQEDILKAQGAEVLMIIEDKARKIHDKSLLHQKLIELYISKKGIELQREIYRDIYTKQMDQDKNINNKIKNSENIKCNKCWPICLVNLHTEQKKKFDGVFIFRNNHDLVIQNNHFSLKEVDDKKRLFQTEDFSNVNNFLIVRLNHTCSQQQQLSSPKKQQPSAMFYQQKPNELKTQSSIDINQPIVGQELYQDNQNQEKPPSILRLGQRVVSYFATEEEIQRFNQEKQNSEREAQNNLASIKEEEGQNIKRPQNDSKQNIQNQQKYDEEMIEAMRNTPKQIFNELNKTKLKEDNFDDVEIIDTDENCFGSEQINSLQSSSLFKFYSTMKVKNPVFNGLLRSDISNMQNKYFENVMH